jgi:hypothetical protein
MTEIIQPEVHCITAEQFLEALSPLGQFFKEINLTEAWLFRGQGQDFPLVPSAFRAKTRLELLTSRNIDDYKSKCLAIRDALVRFFEIADKRGLMLPDDSQDFRSIFEALKAYRGDQYVGIDREWKPENIALSLAALAQHYGIPTSLLDWTRQPFTAAYFAAEDVVKNSYDESSYLVVWGFYFPILGKHDNIAKLTDPIQVVTAPSATNPNLKAQQGLFTLIHPNDTKEAEGEYLPFEKMLLDFSNETAFEESHSELNGIALRKFTLPVSEATRLLCLLAKLDVTHSLIYPGFHRIGEDIELEIQWLKKSDEFKNLL